jgi:soluble lytic murein transglycosylase-like protein
LAIIALGALTAPAARASVAHTIAPGESLSSIAAIDGLSRAELAAANGLSPDALLIAGRTLTIPERGASTGSAGSTTSSSSASTSNTSTSSASTSRGSFVVPWGDTLSQIAARAGVSTRALAAANGLSVDGVLPAGQALTIPGGGGSGLHTTSESVSSAQISELATSHGVPPALSTAVAWQESGFNNRLVSSAGARGVMQIMPGTWNFIQDRLASSRLDTSSALENVHAGVMYLGYLLHANGGDSSKAVASYYQGLGSVQRDGERPETRHYVANVMALRDRFRGR